jgi:Na+-transporting methylmalonyl-CoA/oxaloacetate decarboxylase gamma subunit
MSDIFQGLGISLLGMLITFSFFGLLILLIVALRLIAPVGPPEEEAQFEEATEPEQPQLKQENNRMKAAGVAAAIALLRAKQQTDSGLGQLLEDPPGRWWHDAQQED